MVGKRKFDISREFIGHAIRNMGNDSTGLPEKATLVGIEYNAEKDIYHCVFESEEWENTPEGYTVPEGRI